MDAYKHILLFDYFGQKDEREVDDLFTFSVRYHNKFSNRNLVKESERIIVPLGVTEIHLLNESGKDKLIYKWNNRFVDLTDDISGFLNLQFREVTLKMLFKAILDNCDGMTISMRLSDIAPNYD